MTDKEVELEDIEASDTLGGAGKVMSRRNTTVRRAKQGTSHFHFKALAVLMFIIMKR